MRDLPAFLGGTRPRTTLIVDGRPVGFNEFVFGATPIWDVERIEVFRSPQTTTQGPNSISGAIFVNTRDPADVPEYRARAIAGEAQTRQLSAVASGPLVTDVAYRISGDYRTGRPSSKIGDRAVGADPDKDRHALIRFKLHATPSAWPGLGFEMTFTHTHSQMPQIEGIARPFKERKDPNAGYGIFRIDVDSLVAVARYQPSDTLALKALITAGDSAVQRFAPAGLGQAKIGARDLFAEGLFNWTPGKSLRLVGGVSHSHRSLRQFINLSVLVGEGRFRDIQDGTGVFGEASWSPIPRAELVAGLRYQRDTQTRTGALGSGASAIALDFRKSFEAWLPKVSLAYDLTPDVRVGALVQRAYNPGGTTLRFDTGQPDPFDAETLWDYELFARGSFAGGALRASANLFYYDLRDAQRSEPILIRAPNGLIVGFADLFNLPRARTLGLEGELAWRVSPRLSGRIGLGLLETEVVRGLPGNGTSNGKEFARAPRFSGSAAVDWRPSDRLRLSAQLRRNSRYFSDDLNTPARRVAGWTRLDARAEWQAGTVSLFAYARNLLDDFHLTHVFNANFAHAGDPREAGIGLEVGF
jgi:outer membrane receptor protein involved in Fe transport